jgi:hypothetical protein
MGEAKRRGSYDDRRANPKGTAWRKALRPSMTGALAPSVDTRTGRWWPGAYRPGQRIEYSDRAMVADAGGSLRRVTSRRFES